MRIREPNAQILVFPAKLECKCQGKDHNQYNQNLSNFQKPALNTFKALS